MAFVAEQFSDYFRRSIQVVSARDAGLQQLNELIQVPVDSEAIERLLGTLSQHNPPEAALRQTRQIVFMSLMERDLTGQAGLSEVCTAMTALATLTTQYAMRIAAGELRDDFGTPRDADQQPIDLLAVGMGKAGAGELNVSSDLDLVFLIRDEGETDGLAADGEPARRGSIAASDFAHRLARRTIQLLADQTADGIVFRIDTRLRPNGDSGPLVCTLSSLEVYFQVQGREWERFAWLKASVIADSGLSRRDQVIQDCSELASLVQPFVFRRYHDYDVFGALKEVHELIQSEANKRDARREEGQDVKLGRGGIREVEFIAQLFQIVRGGRDRGLRNRATLPTLDSLGERGLLDAGEINELRDAYQLLRRCEHMLQYRDDQQTHFLPAQEEIQQQVAAMMGMTHQAFSQQLARCCSQVGQLFDSLLDTGNTADPADALSGETACARDDADHTADDTPHPPDPEIARQIDVFVEGPRYRSARPDAQQAMDSLLQMGLQRSLTLPGLQRLLALLETICRRPAYIALLAQYPKAFERVLVIMESSEWAANYLTRHPVLLDELIDGHLYAPTDLRQWRDDLQAEMNALVAADATDTEMQMNVAREWHHAQLFRILAREIAGQLPIQTVADELSELADQTLAVALQTVWNQFPEKTHDTPKLAIIAYGRLGGKELGYASDLDLVFIYDDNDPDAAHVYSRLTRRIATWMSVQTPAGQLFEIDLRLRPNGEAGVLVSSLAGFAEYQRQSAWVWEHQALTRARFCAGDAGVGERFEQLRAELLSMPRDQQALRREVIAMRQKMVDGHPNRSDLFDLKHDRGGMVDIEFVVQFLVLAHAGQFDALIENVGNIALLRHAGAFGLIPPALAEEAAEAYGKMRSLQHGLRMTGAQYARVPEAQVKHETDTVCALWKHVIEPEGQPANDQPN